MGPGVFRRPRIPVGIFPKYDVSGCHSKDHLDNENQVGVMKSG
jgi:hypothetical protein